VDGIVEQWIKMVFCYVVIEGGLFVSVYMVVIAVTIGFVGGVFLVVVLVVVVIVMVDVVYFIQFQFRLVYDVAVFYCVLFDLFDFDDLWKLIRVVFIIKGGEVIREGVVKVVFVFVWLLIKCFYSKGVLVVAKGLFVVGKFFF